MAYADRTDQPNDNRPPDTASAEQDQQDVRAIKRLSWLSIGATGAYLLVCIVQLVMVAIYVAARIHYWQDPTADTLAQDNAKGDQLASLQPVLTVMFFVFLLSGLPVARRSSAALRRQGTDTYQQAARHWTMYALAAALVVFFLCRFISPHLASLQGMDPASAVAALQHYRQNDLAVGGLRIACIAVYLVAEVLRHRRVLSFITTAHPRIPARAVATAG